MLRQLSEISADEVEEAINFKATFLETEFQELPEKFGHSNIELKKLHLTVQGVKTVFLRHLNSF